MSYDHVLARFLVTSQGGHQWAGQAGFTLGQCTEFKASTLFAAFVHAGFALPISKNMMHGSICSSLYADLLTIRAQSPSGYFHFRI